MNVLNIVLYELEPALLLCRGRPLDRLKTLLARGLGGLVRELRLLDKFLFFRLHLRFEVFQCRIRWYCLAVITGSALGCSVPCLLSWAFVSPSFFSSFCLFLLLLLSYRLFSSLVSCLFFSSPFFSFRFFSSRSSFSRYSLPFCSLSNFLAIFSSFAGSLSLSRSASTRRACAFCSFSCSWLLPTVERWLRRRYSLWEDTLVYTGCISFNIHDPNCCFQVHENCHNCG